MNPLKKIQLYFIGDMLARTEDVFEQVKAELLFNFTAFFLISNIPYVFVSTGNTIHFFMGLSTLLSLIAELFVIKKTGNLRLATYFFFVNFALQLGGHYTINNGRMEEQGILFSALFAMFGFLLHDRRAGFIISMIVVAACIVSIYNHTTAYSLWHFPATISDPPEEGNMKYLALIPLSLNVYLISEFVKARQKAERQLAEQKRMIEEKQKEILDSIHYAKRIQKSLLTPEQIISKTLARLKKK